MAEAWPTREDLDTMGRSPPCERSRRGLGDGRDVPRGVPGVPLQRVQSERWKDDHLPRLPPQLVQLPDGVYRIDA